MSWLIQLYKFFEKNAENHSQKKIFEFISPNSKKTITYEQLIVQSKTLAAYLQQHTQFGDRVLLSYSPGLDFIIAFLGCLQAGVVAVPAGAIIIQNDLFPC